jgi:pilus assembly protein TadC
MTDRLKRLGKNLLAGFVGAIFGMTGFLIYLLKFWLPMNAENIGLGIIIIAPIMIIFFSLGGIIVGGILGVVIYRIVRKMRLKKKKKGIKNKIPK